MDREIKKVYFFLPTNEVMHEEVGNISNMYPLMKHKKEITRIVYTFDGFRIDIEDRDTHKNESFTVLHMSSLVFYKED